MTELIVALDGHQPATLLRQIHKYTDVRWFKVGPQTLASRVWPEIMRAGFCCRIFMDLKLADTSDTVREAVRRFACAGVAAVSTYTEAATEAALDAAVGFDLKVWRVAALTEKIWHTFPIKPLDVADGLISPLHHTSFLRERYPGKPLICPGIRISENDNFGCHTGRSTVAMAARAGVDFIVVGRPIYQSQDPVGVVNAIRCGLRRE